MRADSVTPADLKGLPPEVGRELRGPDGKIDPVEMVRYALDHWDKKDDRHRVGEPGHTRHGDRGVARPGPEMEHVAAWSGPVLGRSAMVACLLLARWIRRRCGVRIWDAWPGLLAFVCALLNAVAVLLELFMMWAACTPDGSGPILGDCG
ncbi:hypothetical protein AB0M92_18305 [Streptomyces sp. NPDC051582]|uniref:hypothetical protein n=1 Tax=Streptomyces sp. NPDC051582 TaxID=3155167 RepID=UPI003437CBF1